LSWALAGSQVSGSDDVFGGMARTLQCFKTWLDGGNGGPSWSLEPENHEGWRVVVDEGELQLCRFKMAGPRQGCCSGVVKLLAYAYSRRVSPSLVHTPAPWKQQDVAMLGLRCTAGDGRRGWLLLRASLHDPLLVLNVESDVPGGAANIASQVPPILERVPYHESMLGVGLS
jgi:hypothetical protein